MFCISPPYLLWLIDAGLVVALFAAVDAGHLPGILASIMLCSWLLPLGEEFVTSKDS